MQERLEYKNNDAGFVNFGCLSIIFPVIILGGLGYTGYRYLSGNVRTKDIIGGDQDRKITDILDYDKHITVEEDKLTSFRVFPQVYKGVRVAKPSGDVLLGSNKSVFLPFGLSEKVTGQAFVELGHERTKRIELSHIAEARVNKLIPTTPAIINGIPALLYVAEGQKGLYLNLNGNNVELSKNKILTAGVIGSGNAFKIYALERFVQGGETDTQIVIYTVTTDSNVTKDYPNMITNQSPGRIKNEVLEVTNNSLNSGTTDEVLPNLVANIFLNTSQIGFTEGELRDYDTSVSPDGEQAAMIGPYGIKFGQNGKNPNFISLHNLAEFLRNSYMNDENFQDPAQVNEVNAAMVSELNGETEVKENIFAIARYQLDQLGTRLSISNVVWIREGNKYIPVLVVQIDNYETSQSHKRGHALISVNSERKLELIHYFAYHNQPSLMKNWGAQSFSGGTVFTRRNDNNDLYLTVVEDTGGSTTTKITIGGEGTKIQGYNFIVSDQEEKTIQLQFLTRSPQDSDDQYGVVFVNGNISSDNTFTGEAVFPLELTK